MRRERYPEMPVLLATIGEEPVMFLGQPTIRALYLWLCGIEFAEDFHGSPPTTTTSGSPAAPLPVLFVETPIKLGLISVGIVALLIPARKA